MWVIYPNKDQLFCVCVLKLGGPLKPRTRDSTRFICALSQRLFLPPSTVGTMSRSQTSATTSSSSNYEAVFDKALEAYERKTKKDLRSHPLLSKLESCDSPDIILVALREQVSESGDDRRTKWLNPTVNVLYNFSEVIGGGISLVRVRSFLEKDVTFIVMKVYPPAGVIFTGIGVLLSVRIFFDSFT